MREVDNINVIMIEERLVEYKNDFFSELTKDDKIKIYGYNKEDIKGNTITVENLQTNEKKSLSQVELFENIGKFTFHSIASERIKTIKTATIIEKISNPKDEFFNELKSEDKIKLYEYAEEDENNCCIVVENIKKQDKKFMSAGDFYNNIECFEVKF